MSNLTYLLFFAVCLISSVVGSISGIGGGIIIKPVLEAVSDFGVETISFLSGCTVLSMAVVSLVRQRKSVPSFEYRRGTLLALGSAVGGVLGKLLFDAIGGGGILGRVQSTVLGAICVLLLLYLICKRHLPPCEIRSAAGCVVLGAMMGMLSAFLGIGGGPLNLAILTCFLAMDNKKAALHSIYIILFSQSASLLLTVIRGNVPVFAPSLLACVICAGILGAFVGSAIVMRIDGRAVGRLYGAVLVLVLSISIYNLIGYL